MTTGVAQGVHCGRSVLPHSMGDDDTMAHAALDRVTVRGSEQPDVEAVLTAEA